jgi:alkyl hydroperoxide reductase subunit AhpC
MAATIPQRTFSMTRQSFKHVHDENCNHGHNGEEHGHHSDSEWDGDASEVHWVSENVYYPEVKAKIGQIAPLFTCDAVVDNEITNVSLDDYAGKWTYLFFYPKDWTFVCPTEIISFSDRLGEFHDLNAEVLGVSCDSVNSHLAWIQHPRKMGGLGNLRYPLLSDMTKSISAAYGALMEDVGFPLRASYIINPEGKLLHLSMNQPDVGRSVDEALRLIKAYQHAEKHGEVCPANWTPGAATIVPDPVLSQDYFGTGATEAKGTSGTGSSKSDSAVVNVATPDELDRIVKSGKKVVVQFSATWCGKCHQIGNS